jgi:hypothetical protein
MPPPALPLWPQMFIAAPVSRAAVSSSLSRQRWVIVDGTVRLEVTAADFVAALEHCRRVEVLRYPHDDAVTNVCYR